MLDIRGRRMDILRRVGSGELSLEEGNRLLFELEEGAQGGIEPAPEASSTPQAIDPPPGASSQDVSEPVPAQESLSVSQPDPQPAAGEAAGGSESSSSPSGWQPLWILPFLLGLLLTMVSINWMYLGFAAAGLSWGFWLSFFPLALGVLLMWLGWEARLARWLHLRVRQSPGASPAQFAISLPLPIGLARWAVQHFGRFSPHINGQEVGEFLGEFDQAIATDEPLHIFVSEENGQQVEIWIDRPKSS